MGTRASSRPRRSWKTDFAPSLRPTTFFATMRRIPFWISQSPKTRPYAQILGHLWPTSYAVSGFLFDVSLASLSNNSLSVNGETLSTVLVHKMIHGIFFYFHNESLRYIDGRFTSYMQGFNRRCYHNDPQPGSLREARQPRNPLLTINEDELLYHAAAMFEHEGRGRACQSYSVRSRRTTLHG